MRSDTRDLSPERVENGLERVVEGYTNRRVWEDHRERYRFALTRVRKGDRVVDCACGSGYGSAHLARRAREVVGVDCCALAVEYARRRYALPNVRFQVGSAERLPLASDSCDLFVSFETIEHLGRPDLLIEEARRILRPGGLLLLSTPNRVRSGLGPGERPANPHHVQEWSLREFAQLLSPRFPVVSFFGQRIKARRRASALYVCSRLKRAFGLIDVTPLSARPDVLEALEGKGRCTPGYYLALCRRV